MGRNPFLIDLTGKHFCLRIRLSGMITAAELQNLGSLGMALNSNLSARLRFLVMSHFEQRHLFVSDEGDVMFDRLACLHGQVAGGRIRYPNLCHRDARSAARWSLLSIETCAAIRLLDRVQPFWRSLSTGPRGDSRAYPSRFQTIASTPVALPSSASAYPSDPFGTYTSRSLPVLVWCFQCRL